MILKRLILKDFRQFEGGGNKIDFTPIQDKHITLIFASNGVGKTTILSAIVWCLYGGDEIHYGDQRNVFLNKNTFDSMPNNSETAVEVNLIFEDRGHDYTVKRSLIVKKVGNQQENIKFNEVIVEIDNKPQHDGQSRIDEVLNNKMHGYFFFKGEGVGKYAEQGKSNLVQQGIKNIMKIDTRENALKLIESTRKQFEKDASELQKKLGTQDVPEAKKKEIEEKIEQINSEIAELNSKIETFDELIKDNQASLLRVNSTKHLTSEASMVKNNLEKTIKTIADLETKQKALISQTAFMALSEEVFKTTDDILDLKRKAGELPIIGISKEFIDSIIEHTKCICGTSFKHGDDCHQNLIKAKHNTTAKSNIEATVSSLGVFIEANKDTKSIFEKEFRQISEKIKDGRVEQNKYEERLMAIEKRIEKELPQEDNLIKKRNEHILGRDKCKERLVLISDEKERLGKELREVQRAIESAGASDHELQLARRRAGFCNQAIELLSIENARVIEGIRLELADKLKNRFETMLHSNKTAELDEDFNLRILEKGLPTAKSDGEDKLISLIFISTLIDMARERERNASLSGDGTDPGAGIYPIVIDSPYGEFDSTYKQSISQAVVDLAPQVIILMNQEQWNNGRMIGSIFKDKIAHTYALVAHRPKLDIFSSEKNQLEINGLRIDLEIQDGKEFTTIERIGD